jgi:hypothetical protein
MPPGFHWHPEDPMRITRYLITASIAAAALTGWACDSNEVTGTSRGGVIVHLKDAPFPSDSVDSVNVFVTRVEMRAAVADSAASDSATSTTEAAAHGWITVASPGKVYNLLSLRNGLFAVLDTADVAAGNYNSMRLVIDPSKSNVRLKSGLNLSGTTTPNVSFPSGASSGIKINLSGGLNVVAGDTATVIVDFDLDQSFVMRGNSITNLGLLFKPVILASVSNE